MTSFSNKWCQKLYIRKLSFGTVLDGIQLRFGEAWLQILCMTSSWYWRFSRQVVVLTTLDQLTAELKSGLNPENDRVSLSLEHPELDCQSLSMCLYNNQKTWRGSWFSHTYKAVQRQHILLLDGKMRLIVTVARGVRGSGRLNLSNAKNFNDYFQRKLRHCANW